MENIRYIFAGAVAIITYSISKPILKNNLGLENPLIAFVVAVLCFVSLSGLSGNAIIHLYGAMGLTMVFIILLSLLMGVCGSNKARKWFKSDMTEDSESETETDIEK